MKSEVRAPGPFSEVEARGAFTLRVTLGAATHGVTIEGDENLLAEIVTESNGKRLMIKNTRSLSLTRALVITVTAPDLTLVRTGGAADVEVRAIDNARFQLDIDGSGKAEATGRTQKLKVYVNGVGTALMAGLATREALVMIDGAGRIELAEPAELEAEIHGAGVVRYSGDGKVTSHIRGAGSIEKR